MMWGATFRWAQHLRIRQVAARLWRMMRSPWFASRAYRRILMAGTADAPIFTPPALWPGDAENGRRLQAGRIRILERERPFGSAPDWNPEEESPLWRFTLHYFEWLADLANIASPEAAERARSLVVHWIAEHPGPGSAAWHPYPLSLRIYSWLVHAPFLLDGADDDFRRVFLKSLHAQARHLPHVMETDVGGNHLIKNLKARLASVRCLTGDARMEASLWRALRRALRRQILADGCHEERSPYYHVQVLCDLVDLASMPGAPAPDWLDGIIRQMGEAYVFLRHGDGGLALFNDGTIGDAAQLAALDAVLSPLPISPRSLPEAGYYRLQDGDALVIIDAGRCVPDDLVAHAHADTLSFEMSVGAQRVVVNSGTYAYQDPVWRKHFRSTAAHSTVALAGSDSAEVFGAFRLGRRPMRVDVLREESAIEASHDGYHHLHMTHRRRWTLAGATLSGHDWIEGAAGSDVVAHFHLHPTVRVEDTGSGWVMLQFADGKRLRFSAQGGTVTVASSFFAPRFNKMTPCRQIMLKTKTGATGAHLAWSFAPA